MNPWEFRQKQSLPYEAKIVHAVLRAVEAIAETFDMDPDRVREKLRELGVELSEGHDR